jgi:hypothetical protein
MVGGFNILEGFFALLSDKYLAQAVGEFYVFDRSTWVWIHIVLGLILLAIGFGLLSAKTWARVSAIAIAVLSCFVQMMYLPIYPFWTLVNIAILVVVIWTLMSAPDVEQEE